MMGKSDVQLHRSLSVPSNVALCGRDGFSFDKEITFEPSDNHKIYVRHKSVTFQTISSFSSGTGCKKLPNSLCTSDIDTRSIKSTSKVTCNSFDIEMVRSMLRVVRNRRAAMGYIFQDTNPEELNNLLSGYDNRTNSEASVSTVESGIHQHRRPALADIFQDLDEDALEHLLSLYDGIDDNKDMENDSIELTNSGRRFALPDIFTNINDEELEIFLKNCRHDLERMDALEIIEEEMPTRCRRFAKGNIFSDLAENDIRRILSAHERDTNTEERSEQNGLLCRRLALGNIFNNVTEVDVMSLLTMCKAGVNSESNLESDEEIKDQRTRVNSRRFALADIFQYVDESDLTKVLTDICTE